MIRLLLADNHTIVRWALREALSAADDLEIIGETGTAVEMLAMLRDLKPDVLVLEPTLSDRSGIEILNDLRQLEVAPLVVVLTWRTEPSYAARTIAAGAHGYVQKSAPPEELLRAIRAVTRGERVVPPGIDELLASGVDPAGSLTARELQVMEMLARGMTNREIGEHLGISGKTVDTHRGHVLKKLGVRNNSELTSFAVKHGFITP